jgi:hypothetical protein
MLALFCRAENNRRFLNSNMELRPGFLSKWIEVIVYDESADAKK